MLYPYVLNFTSGASLTIDLGQKVSKEARAMARKLGLTGGASSVWCAESWFSFTSIMLCWSLASSFLCFCTWSHASTKPSMGSRVLGAKSDGSMWFCTSTDKTPWRLVIKLQCEGALGKSSVGRVAGSSSRSTNCLWACSKAFLSVRINSVNLSLESALLRVHTFVWRASIFDVKSSTCRSKDATCCLVSSVSFSGR